MRTIVIGNGPAGISAALYLKRAGMDVTILAKDGGALMKAEAIENYYIWIRCVGFHTAKISCEG